MSKIGIVGFGKLGLLHTGLMNGLQDCEVTAVADPSSLSLQMLKSQMPSISIFDSHKSLLKSKIVDAVFICTPSFTHADIAKDFIREGIPLFIEKPLSTSYREAAEVIQLLKANPVVNMVGYMSRHIDTFKKTKQILDSKILGKVQMVHTNMYIGQLFKKGKGWRYSNKQSGGGVLITQNSHLLDLLIWMFGEVNFVSGHCRSLFSAEVEDWFNGFIEFKSGISCAMDTSWSKRHHRTLSMNIDIQTENGTLSVNEDEIRIFLNEPSSEFQSGWTILRKPDLFEGVEFDIGGAHFSRQAEEFRNALLTGKSPQSDIKSAAEVQCVIEAMYQSAQKNGTPIKPDDLKVFI